MNKLIISGDINIEYLIYEIRGVQVILDSDIARIYEIETKRVNEAVRNNPKKFLERFSFVLSSEEFNNLRSIFSTSSYIDNSYGGRRYNPRVFTEQGVAMLATILKSEKAIEVSIRIMDAFVKMRHHISNSLLSSDVVEHKLLNLDKRVDIIEETLSGFKEKNNHLFFEGQIYDAYSLMIDILSKAKSKITIIDNYAGKELFDILRDIAVPIYVYSKNFNSELISKYKNQYSNIIPLINVSFHDRFIVLDDIYLYHSGSSFKDFGNKCFAITMSLDEIILNDLLSYLAN